MDGVGVADVVALALGEVDAFAVGDALTFTLVPLFQTKFFPDFTQKYLTPPVVLVEPTLVHFVPAIVAALEKGATEVIRADTMITANFDLICIGKS